MAFLSILICFEQCILPCLLYFLVPSNIPMFLLPESALSSMEVPLHQGNPQKETLQPVFHFAGEQWTPKCNLKMPVKDCKFHGFNHEAYLRFRSNWRSAYAWFRAKLNIPFQAECLRLFQNPPTREEKEYWGKGMSCWPMTMTCFKLLSLWTAECMNMCGVAVLSSSSIGASKAYYTICTLAVVLLFVWVFWLHIGK